MISSSTISTVSILVGLTLANLGCESGSTTSAPGGAATSAPGGAATSAPGGAATSTPGAATTSAPREATTSASGGAAPPAVATAKGATEPAAVAGSTARFGAAFEPGASVPLATLVSNPAAYENRTVTTEGKVQRACSKKGCWMEIGAGDDACRVTFKDYAFFVPTDSAGAHVKIQGRLDTRQVEAAAVDHLEAEGARFRNKKADGSATEVRLIASAVELTR